MRSTKNQTTIEIQQNQLSHGVKKEINLPSPEGGAILLLKNKSILVFLLLLSLFISSCNMPQNAISPAEQTAIIDASIAETVAAGGEVPPQSADSDPNQLPTDTPDSSDTPEPDTPTPSDTPEPDTPTPSDTPIPCNLAKFVSDVSIPDGTTFQPGDTFTKTWRLQNVGSCAWTSGYDIVFSGGDAMDAPASVQLTAGTVNPGQNVNISVDMTAPVSEGTYRGNWKLREPGDELFGIENSSSGLFWVEIEVEEPVPTENTVTILLASRGQVEDGLDVRTNANNAGDTSVNVGLQGFVTFDVSGIPNGSTIISAKLAPVSFDTLGDPFGSLGCMRAYVHNYDTVGFEDFKPAGVTDAIVRFCNEAELNISSEQTMSATGISGIQDALVSNKFQIRLQYKEMHSDGDGIADVLRPTLKIIVTYEEP